MPILLVLFHSFSSYSSSFAKKHSAGIYNSVLSVTSEE